MGARPVSALAAKDELRAFVHDGFWYPMDTLRDKIYLEEQWTSGQAKVENLVISSAFWLDKRVFLTGTRVSRVRGCR